MNSLHHPTPEFPAHLEALYRQFPFERSLARDPLSCIRPLRENPTAAEVAGIFAATLAIGNVTSIRRAYADLERRIGHDFVALAEPDGAAEARPALRSFRHRWIRGNQLSFLAGRVAATRREHGSLGELFRGGLEDGGFVEGLDRLAQSLRGPRGSRATAPRGYRALFPTPIEGSHSPCKRLTLYIRWMSRSGFPDLGVWRGVPSSELRIPLDLHVYWIAYHLGLTHRRTRNWKTVEEVTAQLRTVDPLDPIKYDFVLCHTGISGDCPKERDLSVCGPCVVRPDCLLWRHTRRGS
ncbi:MAG: DUF2400 domain-containing protein [Thermoplasmata archaeon]|nr:DUF2400 domain-containing protein [Thermoplasmata archaeon]